MISSLLIADFEIVSLTIYSHFAEFAEHIAELLNK